MKEHIKQIALGLVLSAFLSGNSIEASESKSVGTGSLTGEITLESKPSLSGSLTGTITLQQVIAQVLLKNPELEAFSLEIRAREARALQAGLFPNPKLGIETEDVGGSGNFSGFSRSQTTIQLSQLIELGGKRSSRVRAASLSRDLANWDYEIKRMDVLTQVSKYYTELLRAQRRVSLVQELVGLAEKSWRTVFERVKAGKVSPIEEIKAKVALSSTQIKLEQARRERKVAQRRLAATWGATDLKFESAQGNLEIIAPVPSLYTLKRSLSNNPALARWAAETVKRQAEVDRELSKRIPDIELTGGYRRLEQTNDHSLVFGIIIPLQFFDRNQGAIQEARHRLAKAEAEQRSARVKVNVVLTEAYYALANAHSEVVSLKTQVLPGAQKAFQAVNEGYRFGKFGLLDVLDSQRTFFEARDQFLRGLAKYHMAVADVERLTGKSLATLNEPLANLAGEFRP